jgi:hypothetical protein
LWARAGAASPEAVVRCLCDWAVADGFLPQTFADRLGDPVDLFTMWEDSRAATEAGHVRLADGTTLIKDVFGAQHRLREIRVAVAGVLAFCESTATLPPPQLRRGVRGWLADRHKQHRSPPPCMAAAEIVLRHDQEQFEAGVRLGETRQRSWKPRPPRLRRGPLPGADVTAPPPGDDSPAEPLPEDRLDLAAPLSEPRRRRGRPKGAVYDIDPLVDQMRAGMAANPKLIKTEAARQFADKAGGPGDEASKIHRLLARYKEKFGE